jgi:hypothetical protein
VAGAATQDFFLHGSGGTANPPNLFLSTAAPTGTGDVYKDSTSINFSGGNPWKEVGTWTAAPALPAGTLAALSDLHIWAGLRNSDDQGTFYDLKSEGYRNGVLVASGLTRCVQGITRNPDLAKEVTVAFGSFSSVEFNGTSDQLALKLWTRIGTNPDNTKCAGSHNNAIGLRAYFDSTSRQPRFGATINPNPTPTTLTPDPLTVVVGATGNLTATLSPALSRPHRESPSNSRTSALHPADSGANPPSPTPMARSRPFTETGMGIPPRSSRPAASGQPFPPARPACGRACWPTV